MGPAKIKWSSEGILEENNIIMECGCLSTILAKGSTWRPGRQATEKMTLYQTHFLKIVYDGLNELSNLFSWSWHYENKNDTFFGVGLQV